MADTFAPLCAGRDGTNATHCWHTVWVPSYYQAGQQNSDGMKCCWCGAVAPLTVGYSVPVPHGPHEPANPFQRGAVNVGSA